MLETHFTRLLSRNVALRLLHTFSANNPQSLTQEEVAIIRLQRSFYASRLARLASEDAPPLEELMPTLFGLPPPQPSRHHSAAAATLAASTAGALRARSSSRSRERQEPTRGGGLAPAASRSVKTEEEEEEEVGSNKAGGGRGVQLIAALGRMNERQRVSKWRALRLAAKMRVHRGGDAPHSPLTTPSSSAAPAAAAPVASVGGLQSHIDAQLSEVSKRLEARMNERVDVLEMKIDSLMKHVMARPVIAKESDAAAACGGGGGGQRTISPTSSDGKQHEEETVQEEVAAQRTSPPLNGSTPPLRPVALGGGESTREDSPLVRVIHAAYPEAQPFFRSPALERARAQHAQVKQAAAEAEVWF